VGYIGVFADAGHSDCDVFPTPWSMFTVWIWCLPSINGMSAAEFAISIPDLDMIIKIDEIQNPQIILSLGSLDTGISIVFDECQTEWVWTHQIQCLPMGTISPDVIEIIPHPEAGEYQFASCLENFPVEPCISLSPLYVNDWCLMCHPPDLPDLTDVIVESPSKIRAVFDQCLWPTGPARLFVLYDAADPLDSILVTEATSVAENQYDLTLAEPMIGGTTYSLYQRSYVWSCSEGYYSDSRIEFTYSEETATLLLNHSISFNGTAVELAWELSESDEDLEFLVSRSGNGAGFTSLEMTRLSREGLIFRYTDPGVEPGMKYVYKVDYELRGERRQLLLSEEIRTPAAFLALDQNRPNPFNPSTTISFTLPVECAVRFEIFDVSGRLVRRLVDGEKRGSGLNTIEWNGRDSSGRTVVSGIYIYRLTAGKESISRKMVMLR